MRLTTRRRAGVALVAVATFVASLAAAPSPASAQGPVLQPATTATIYYWNDVLLETFRREGGGPTPLSRAAAMMHIGIYDTVNTQDWQSRQWVGDGFNWYTGLVQPGPAFDGFDWAAGKVASELLIDNFPAQQAFIQQAFISRHGATPFPGAMNVVNEILPRVRSARANDGAGDSTAYQFGTQPGAWQLTGGPCDAPVTPNWGRVSPFTRTPITQFTQSHPGGHTTYASLLASQLYANHLNEVKALGRFDSTTRTAVQEEIAWFWANDLDGTYKPPGQALDHTRIVAQQQGLTNALTLSRLFAHVSIALADAGIAAWYQKYETAIDLWRPETAIQRADEDGNPNTAPDPNWLPLSAGAPPSQDRFNPCFPAWVSGHATFAAAWAGIMRNRFGDATSLTLDSEDPRAIGVQRSFNSFTQIAEENARSRIYLGVHFQFDADDGLATGFSIADHVHGNLMPQLTCNAPIGVVCW